MEAATFPQGTVELTLPNESRLAAGACRALDVAGAAALLVLLSPIFLAVVLAIRLDSPGRAIFRQRRVGRNLEPFTVLKFRSMYSSAGHDTHREYVMGLITLTDERRTDGGLYKLTTDARVTPVGRFLRRSSLDELPQLINVLRGEMSLVGPRPSIPYEVEKYPTAWMGRFSVRPGITGLWQVSGRSQLTWEQMIALDVEYVRRRSFWFNVLILLKTMPAVLLGKGAA